ncbi:MAG TPA: lipid-A-disaccharide synthase [Chitinophagaceae bacterium]
MKYYIIAGEASGDLHGSNLIKEIKKLDANADIRCWGGDLMQAEGATLVKHYRDLAFMGFIEVIQNLSTILKNIRFCKEDISRYHPDVIIFIDYPGFNLRIAKWAKEQKYKTVYYISPQVWAWKESRVKTIKQVVDKMIVILPFEKDFYESKWQYKVDYVGHPLVQVINDFKESSRYQNPYNKPVITILPGSRKQEVSVKLPVMLEATKNFPDYQFVVAKASSLDDSFYDPMLKDYSNVASVRNETYNLLSISVAAIVTSGTATLETALFGVPQVVCYKGSSISYQIAKRLLKIKYISLVNLIMDKKVVTELIQHEMTATNIQKELDQLLHDVNKKRQLHNDYTDLRELLQQGGNASAKAAGIIVKFTLPAR